MDMGSIDWPRANGELSIEGGCVRLSGFDQAAQVHAPGVLQTLLDAMAIPAVVLIGQTVPPIPLVRNRAFTVLKRHRGGDAHHRTSTAAVHALMAGGPPTATVDWSEEGPGGRHIRVELGRLPPHPQHGPCVLACFLDRTAAIESERSMRFEMLRDGLTGLPNRHAFVEAVEAAIATGTDHAVLTLDLVRFSRVNEGMGALAGDELVITVARRLVEAGAPGGLLARTAGNEFGLLVPLVDGPGDALHAARRLRDALAHPLRLSELEIRVDCAIGVAYVSSGARDGTEVMRNVQFALKRAKRSGRLEIYRQGDAGAARRRFTLETDLRRAIDADQLDLAFQPLIELETSRIAGFEVLARWTPPGQPPISPAEFIAVAEESGLILPLGRWVLDRATATLATWDRAAGRELPIYLGVNVSAVQLARDPVPSLVGAALDRHGIAGGRLTLELTESAIVADPERAKGVLTALKNRGCRIAMDDFGTGYSNLACLQRLPIDILKIDRGFVTGMLADGDSIAIVRAILSLATALGMTTIAEGVEDEQTARVLAALGCRNGQGYHFARPMTADAALAYLLAGRAVAG